jgi:hypothetical protein
MTRGEQRRRRLGQHAVDAAHQSARTAPAPGRALADALAVLLAARIVRDLHRDAHDDPPRDAA